MCWRCGLERARNGVRMLALGTASEPLPAMYACVFICAPSFSRGVDAAASVPVLTCRPTATSGAGRQLHVAAETQPQHALLLRAGRRHRQSTVDAATLGLQQIAGTQTGLCMLMVAFCTTSQLAGTMAKHLLMRAWLPAGVRKG